MNMDPRDPVTPRSTEVDGDALVAEPVVAAPAVDIDPPDDDHIEERKGIEDVTLADLEQLRWGPIWAGLLTAIGLFILMTLPAIALGLQAAPGAEEAQDLGAAAVIVTSVIALIAFFVGGFISTWSAGISDTGRSLVNGFLVWALWLIAGAVLAAVGVGSIAGAMGELFGQLEQPAIDVQPAQLIESIQDSSWQTFLALALTALAATLGGVVGAREELRGTWTRAWTTRIRGRAI